MTPAISYLRVSTEGQLDGFGLDVQRDSVAALADAEGFTIVAEYVDEGICGAEDLSVRLDLAAALDHLGTGDAKVLVIPKLDRLARDMVLQEQVLAEAWRHGAAVVSCLPGERLYCQPDDPTDPSRTLIRQILGAVAQYDRSMIRARLMGGRRRKLARDGYAGGPEPYGWSDPDERAVLDEVRAQRDRGRAWRAIADSLNVAERFKRNGSPWTAADLHRTFTRSTKRSA